MVIGGGCFFLGLEGLLRHQCFRRLSPKLRHHQRHESKYTGYATASSANTFTDVLSSSTCRGASSSLSVRRDDRALHASPPLRKVPTAVQQVKLVSSTYPSRNRHPRTRAPVEHQRAWNPKPTASCVCASDSDDACIHVPGIRLTGYLWVTRSDPLKSATSAPLSKWKEFSLHYGNLTWWWWWRNVTELGCGVAWWSGVICGVGAKEMCEHQLCVSCVADGILCAWWVFLVWSPLHKVTNEKRATVSD